ncbi:hypothetical protein BSK52_28890 [Paenibacillus odorifer]|uniref:Uncharacterized protein n=1 Tax=Paenibacillus odorifer TaxID=189426 RepID=A0A1R0XHN7_9BACL|nr:hypothetical protein BSK52_28890 [Paenibacillus odorifer]
MKSLTELSAFLDNNCMTVEVLFREENKIPDTSQEMCLFVVFVKNIPHTQISFLRRRKFPSEASYLNLDTKIKLNLSMELLI